MLNPGFTRLLRRGLILVFLGACLAAAASSPLPPRTHASNPNYFYSVTIISEVNADHDCWQVGAQGTGCSSTSCDAARTEAIADALNNMPPNCSWQPFRVDSEYCVEGSSCTP